MFSTSNKKENNRKLKRLKSFSDIKTAKFEHPENFILSNSTAKRLLVQNSGEKNYNQ